MAIDIVMLLASLTAILMACFMFTNAIEWFGRKMNLGHSVVGSVLAAVGTALPETIIPIIAICFFKGEGPGQIAVGAIAGAPFMLSTLAFFVTGAAVLIYAALGKRKTKMNADIKGISRDLFFFIIVYGIAVLATFLRGSIIARVIVAVVLLLSYALYLKLTFSHGGGSVEDPEELYFSIWFKVKNSMGLITAQLVLSLAVLVSGADFFVKYTEKLSVLLGMTPLILSILITPIATELPEKMNSVIWVGKGKDTLALGNITGAMVFQSCFPVTFGVLFTPWNLQGVTIVSAELALAAAALNLIWIRITKSFNPYFMLATGALYFLLLVKIFIK